MFFSECKTVLWFSNKIFLEIGIFSLLSLCYHSSFTPSCNSTRTAGSHFAFAGSRAAAHVVKIFTENAVFCGLQQTAANRKIRCGLHRPRWPHPRSEVRYSLSAPTVQRPPVRVMVLQGPGAAAASSSKLPAETVAQSAGKRRPGPDAA